MDLTNPNDVATYILSAKSEIDLGEKCNDVKTANGGDYPDFWYPCIIEFGIMDRVYQNFK